MLRASSYIVSYKKVIIYEYKKDCSFGFGFISRKKAVHRNLFISSQILFCAVVTKYLIWLKSMFGCNFDLWYFRTIIISSLTIMVHLTNCLHFDENGRALYSFFYFIFIHNKPILFY